MKTPPGTFEGFDDDVAKTWQSAWWGGIKSNNFVDWPKGPFSMMIDGTHVVFDTMHEERYLYAEDIIVADDTGEATGFVPSLGKRVVVGHIVWEE